MPGLIRQTCWLALLLCLTAGPNFSQDCDVVIDSSSANVPRQGVFKSPEWPQKYPRDQHCIYKFIGSQNQRVEIKITKFNLQGVAPQCKFDYLDIYIEMSSASDSLMESTMLGRFCGDGIDQLPKLIRSTRNIIALEFYSDKLKSDKGFYGTYEFIDASIYNIGTKIGTNDCSYLIRGTTKKSGFLISPTYPAIYPDNLKCVYQLVGIPGERIKLTFVDFSLFYGDKYCPFDYVAVYDGSTVGSPLIKKFCGNYNMTTIYSSRKDLYIEFVTSSGRIDFSSGSLYDNVDFTSERKGFNITYEFSDALVRIEYNTSNMEHIEGTLCDVRITSRKESDGTIQSPMYPRRVPSNLTCNYYIDGLSNPENLEKVKVSFQDFEIPGDKPNCDKGFLAVNLEGTENEGGVDERFCGTLYPPNLTSKDPRMVLTLDTHGLTWGRGFSMIYQFVTDFGIPGTQVEPGKCKFLYDSAMKKKGKFNSPVGNYPGGVECTYIFRPVHDSGEKLLISFSSFAMGPHTPDPECPNTDFLQIYEKGPNIKQDYIPQKRYCAQTFPGPILGHNGMKIVFHANRNSKGTSFEALYEFLPKSDRRLISYCNEYIHSDGTGGLIKSPGYPEKYRSYAFCNWTVKASKTTNKILLQFHLFHTEGQRSPTDIEQSPGCQNAVVRLYRDDNSPPEEVCGSLTNEAFLSTNDTFRIEKIKKYREEGWEIVYVDETWINTNHACKGEWTHNRAGPTGIILPECTECSRHIPSGKGSRLIVLDAGSSNSGFIEGVGLIFSSKTDSTDYHDEMNGRHFLDWFENTLIPALPNPSVVVLDNAPYHNIRTDDSLYPTSKSRKDEIIEWLRGRGIDADINMLKGVVRYESSPPKVYGSLTNEAFLSTNDTFRLEFLTSSMALGAKGFKITWTEIHDDKGPCYGFRCTKSNYCISSKLKCNRLPNCGKEDYSDEQCPALGGFEIVHIAIGASISSFFCMILVICGFYHRRRFRPIRKPPDNNHVEVRYVAASSSCNTTDRLLAVDNLDELDHRPDGSTPTTPTPHTPNQTVKLVHNTNTSTSSPQITKNNKTPVIAHNKTSSFNSPSSYSSPHQSPSIATVNRTSARTPRIQKVSIV